MNVKIYGERNTGTNYVEQLIKQNLRCKIYKFDPIKNPSGWKHGTPKIDYFNHEKTLFIVMERNLEGWLNSMYHKPYHMKKLKTFEDFLSKPIVAKESDWYIYKYMKKNEEGKSIFDIRYWKYQEFQKLKNYNTIYINLSYLQKNPFLLIKTISKEYSIARKGPFRDINHHSKSTSIKSRNGNYKKYKLNYDLYKNEINKEIENQIENIEIQTFKFKKNILIPELFTFSLNSS